MRLQDYSIWTWMKLCVGIAVLSAISSILFLHLLNFVTQFRDNHNYILLGLPLAGITIIFLYQKFGQLDNQGNNLLLEEYYNPKGIIPILMAPLIILSTLITHLFGGSAGREGTAVQYGGTYGNIVASYLRANKPLTRIALLSGIAAGFGSLFGTPLAGTFFALELVRFGTIRQKAFIPILVTSYLAHYICVLFQAPHTHYPTIQITSYLNIHLLWILFVGLSCGLVARLFIFSNKINSSIFSKIQNPYWRIVLGSILILLIYSILGTTKYIGLGIPTLLESFQSPQNYYDFLLKLLLTSLTLSIGFKGGEVTPLFFIGATFCSFLSIYLGVPIEVMAAIGFVSVFAGATKTPLACAIMAAELFGIAIFPLALVSCIIASYTSGAKSIYSSQKGLYKYL